MGVKETSPKLSPESTMNPGRQPLYLSCLICTMGRLVMTWLDRSGPGAGCCHSEQFLYPVIPLSTVPQFLMEQDGTLERNMGLD